MEFIAYQMAIPSGLDSVLGGRREGRNGIYAIYDVAISTEKLTLAIVHETISRVN